MSELIYRNRTKHIPIKGGKPTLVPLEDKHPATKPSSTIIPGRHPLRFIVTHDVAIEGIPEDSSARIRVVHQKRSGQIVGETGWQDVHPGGFRDANAVITAQGRIDPGHYLRLQVWSPEADVTVRSIETRVTYWR